MAARMCSWRSRMARGLFGWVANSEALNSVPDGDSSTGGRGFMESVREGLREDEADVAGDVLRLRQLMESLWVA